MAQVFSETDKPASVEENIPKMAQFLNEAAENTKMFMKEELKKRERRKNKEKEFHQIDSVSVPISYVRRAIFLIERLSANRVSIAF